MLAELKLIINNNSLENKWLPVVSSVCETRKQDGMADASAARSLFCGTEKLKVLCPPRGSKP